MLDVTAKILNMRGVLSDAELQEVLKDNAMNMGESSRCKHASYDIGVDQYDADIDAMDLVEQFNRGSYAIG